MFESAYEKLMRGDLTWHFSINRGFIQCFEKSFLL